MRVVNKSKKSMIAPECSPYNTIWQHAKGLMFTMSMEKPLLFVFERERKWGLHMLFVFYTIDVLFLDKRKKVVDLKEGFRPFAFYTPKKPCLYIIELPKGIIRKSRTSVGDRIDF